MLTGMIISRVRTSVVIVSLKPDAGTVPRLSAVLTGLEQLDKTTITSRRRERAFFIGIKYSGVGDYGKVVVSGWGLLCVAEA